MSDGPRATGIGGVFFRSPDPDALYRWYERHLGLRRAGDTAVVLRWADDAPKAAPSMSGCCCCWRRICCTNVMLNVIQHP